MTIGEPLVADARKELLARGAPGARSFRWGYLLGVEERTAGAMSRARELASRLYRDVVELEARSSGRDYSLSFLKAADGEPPQAAEGVHYDGFHLDTHPEVDGRGRELARLLINIADTPRRFRYATADRFELARRGCDVPRSDYQVVDLPEDVEIRTIEIPARQPGTVHALRFWASVIPHVGVDDAHGHFLASFEAVAPVSPI